MQKSEEMLTLVYKAENVGIFTVFSKEIRLESVLQVLIAHHHENCDCSFLGKVEKIADFSEKCSWNSNCNETW